MQEAQCPCGANVELCAAVVQMYSKAHCCSGAKEELCAAKVQKMSYVLQWCKRGDLCCKGAKEELCAAVKQMCCSVRGQGLSFVLCFLLFYGKTNNAIVVLPVSMVKL